MKLGMVSTSAPDVSLDTPGRSAFLHLFMGSLDNLKPFQPGHNRPGPGRPSKMALWREKVEADFDAWVQVYLNARASDDPALAMKAADTVFDRLYGKALQPVEHSGAIQLESILFADSLPAADPLELDSAEVVDAEVEA